MRCSANFTPLSQKPSSAAEYELPAAGEFGKYRSAARKSSCARAYCLACNSDCARARTSWPRGTPAWRRAASRSAILLTLCACTTAGKQRINPDTMSRDMVEKFFMARQVLLTEQTDLNRCIGLLTAHDHRFSRLNIY